jgi:hypothetical protein
LAFWNKINYPRTFIPLGIFCLIVIVIALSWWKAVSLSSGKSFDITPENYQIPVYPKAKVTNRFSRLDRQAKGLDFKVRQNFPARDLRDFYEKEMKALGWSPYQDRKNKKSDRTWMGRVSRSKENPRYIAEYTADWIHYGRLEKARLMLSYSWTDYEDRSKIDYSNNQNLSGTITITPYAKRRFH